MEERIQYIADRMQANCDRAECQAMSRYSGRWCRPHPGRARLHAVSWAEALSSRSRDLAAVRDQGAVLDQRFGPQAAGRDPPRA